MEAQFCQPVQILSLYHYSNCLYSLLICDDLRRHDDVICRDAQKISEHLLLLHGDGNYSSYLFQQHRQTQQLYLMQMQPGEMLLSTLWSRLFSLTQMYDKDS